MNNTIVGVDLATKVIQVCVSTNKKVRSNQEMTPSEFNQWLITSKPMTIVFEACGSSNYWKQVALKAKHDARLICPKLVAHIRQSQKTDKNDALAIVQASQLPDIRFISGKNHGQQQLQSMMRLRELAVKQKTALSNQLTSLLLEFNIRCFGKKGGLNKVITEVLEDGENGFSFAFREMLHTARQQYLALIKSIAIYDDKLEEAAKEHSDCHKLRQIEGIGVLSAINLYILLGCTDLLALKKAKDASACIGLTPLQHSSGGKVKIGAIGKHIKNSMMRSYLIVGAMSAINQIVKRSAKTKKEQWIQQLVERRGKRCAAVALANKNVRTAFAMITQGSQYKAELL